MIPHDQESLEMMTALLVESRITKAAQNRLATFGLDISTLGKYAQQGYILDLGADDAFIEREAKLAGFGDKLISADIKFSDEVKKLGLNLREFDATRDWPLEKNKFSLIVCRQGPLFMTETTQEGAMYILNNSLGSLKPDCEFFVFPSRFGFVKKQMFDEYPEYKKLQELESRTKDDSKKNNLFNEEADNRTKHILFELGYTFEVRKSGVTDNQSANSEFLAFKHI